MFFPLTTFAGLEWAVVFVPAAEEGYLPHAMSNTPAAVRSCLPNQTSHHSISLIISSLPLSSVTYCVLMCLLCICMDQCHHRFHSTTCRYKKKNAYCMLPEHERSYSSLSAIALHGEGFRSNILKEIGASRGIISCRGFMSIASNYKNFNGRRISNDWIKRRIT